MEMKMHWDPHREARKRLSMAESDGEWLLDGSSSRDLHDSEVRDSSSSGVDGGFQSDEAWVGFITW